MFTTVEARLDYRLAPDIIDMQKEYMPHFAQMNRSCWHILNRNPDLSGRECTRLLKQRYSIKERTAKSIFRTMQGRRSALMELTKTQKYEMQTKLRKHKQNYRSLKKTVNSQKKKAARNELKEEELAKYRRRKRKLHFLGQKIQRLSARLNKIKKQIRSKKLSMCFGTKKLFRAQFHLKENGYKNHLEWRQDFRRNRDKNVNYLGRNDEIYGNSQCHLIPTDEEGLYKLSILPGWGNESWTDENGKKHVFYDKPVFGYVRIKRNNDLLAAALADARERGKGLPLSARIIRRKRNAFYIQICVEIEKEKEVTTGFYGMIGLDFNSGFLALTETDQHGNMVRISRYDMPHQGKGQEGVNELHDALNQIIDLAIETGKDIVYEELDFMKKKAEITEKSSQRNKNYNRMLHSLNYSQYKEALKRKGFTRGVRVRPVDPSYTSSSGKHFTDLLKLNVHSAAAWMIARRGQGFRSNYPEPDKEIKKEPEKKPVLTETVFTQPLDINSSELPF